MSLQVLVGKDSVKAFARVSALMRETFDRVQALPCEVAYSLVPDDGAIERLAPGRWGAMLSFEGASDWATPDVCRALRRAVARIVTEVGEARALKTFSIADVRRIRMVTVRVIEDVKDGEEAA